MTDQAVRLADLLRRENAALERHDLAAAGLLLAAKQDATLAFANAAQAGGSPAWREIAALAEVNRRLLERAIEVQHEVIGMVARAASGGITGRYTHRGAPMAGRSNAFRSSI